MRPLPQRDRLGRPQHDPARLMRGIGAALWISERIPSRRVPPSFWALDADEQGEAVAVVACPCGHAPIVALLEELVQCSEHDGCDCPRWFFFDGVNVWVYATPTADERTPVVSAAAPTG